MKRRLIWLAALTVCFSLQAVDRIALIDLEKVFREYYKSRIAEDAIKQQAESYRSYLSRLNEQLNAAIEKARTTRSNALNIALSAKEREDAEKLAAQANAAVNEKKAEIELYVSARTQDMRNLETKKRAEIMEDIQKEIRRRAAAEGYAFVFDVSGKTTNDQPVVLVYPKGNDITDPVIGELNRTRSVVNPAPAAGEKK
ncbi:MAG: OmpH family outer membrane protein [Victivallaceae bacterium]|nr:OmpH family outer membrane protein [Victivallaceae bacterium]